MSAPNIVAVATITGKSAVLVVTASDVAIITNAAASGKVIKVNALYASNIHATTAGTVEVSLLRGGVYYRIAPVIDVPIKSTLDVINKNIYLEEGDALTIKANATSYIEAVASYEELS